MEYVKFTGKRVQTAMNTADLTDKASLGWVTDLIGPTPPSKHWLMRGWLNRETVVSLNKLSEEAVVRLAAVDDLEAGVRQRQVVSMLVTIGNQLTVLATRRDYQRRGCARMLVERALDEHVILVHERVSVTPPPLGWVKCAERLGGRFEYTDRSLMRVTFEKGKDPVDPNPFGEMIPLDWELSDGGPEVSLLREIER